jgi:hypothetical protein
MFPVLQRTALNSPPYTSQLQAGLGLVPETMRARGRIATHWAPSTISRVSNYLMGAASDFGLLDGWHVEVFSIATEIGRILSAAPTRKIWLEADRRNPLDWEKTNKALANALSSRGGQPTRRMTKSSMKYVAYAVECRRRIKEQMNKRKPDDEFAEIDLSFTDRTDKEVIVSCPESTGASATLEPLRRSLRAVNSKEADLQDSVPSTPAPSTVPVFQPDGGTPVFTVEPLTEQHFTIQYDDVGHSYDLIFGPYLVGARAVTIEDPFVRAPHQIANFVRFCETVVKAAPTVRRIHLISSYDDKTDLATVRDKLEELKQSLLEADVFLEIEFNANLHDREVRIDNGWIVKIGRGLDFFQKPESWFSIGANDMTLRRCLETKVDIFRSNCERPEE